MAARGDTIEHPAGAPRLARQPGGGAQPSRATDPGNGGTGREREGARGHAPVRQEPGARSAEVEVRKATLADAPALTETLARAFDADPVLNWALRRDAGRAAAFRRFFALSLRRLTLPHGEVYTTPDRAGAALWTPPGKWRQGLREQLLQLPDWLCMAGAWRAPRVIAALAAVLREHPHAPHYYLFELGVDPRHRGRGLGSALLRPALARCDREGVAAYLENSNPRNLPLYERHGFRVAREFALAGDGPHLWLMWRDPR